ncbi:MAG: histidine phosphatase family protein [Planktomarina sp.]
MTDWYWVRHGPTHERNFVGWRDVAADLSDTALIERVAAHLPIDAVVISSDLSRSIDTATALQDGRTRLPHDPALREFDFGDWDGRHFSDVATTDPELSRKYWEQPGDVIAPNGESWNMAAARVRPAVDTLTQRHDKIIAVAHFGIILTQVQRALGCSAYDALAHKIDNFSITHLHQDGDQWQVHLINHLP